MKKTTVLIAALAAIPLASSAAEPAGVASHAAVRADVAKRISPAAIKAMRDALVAQIAVYDAAEGAMRAPTPAEAAALAPPSTSEAQVPIVLPGGGLALQSGVSQISLVKAVRGDDGKVVVGHDAASVARKEARHGH